MSIESLQACFGWGSEAAEALRRAELMVAEICCPAGAYSAPPEDLDLSLGDGSRSLVDVVGDSCALLSVYGHSARHPGAFAHMVPPPATVSVIGDFIKAAANQCAFTLEQAPLAPLIEKAVLAWAARILRLPPTSGGLITSGGTISNYTAAFLALQRARETAPPEAKLCAFASDQAHFSAAKAVKLLGLPEEALFLVPTDGSGRMPPEELSRIVRRAERDRWRPFLFVCTGGTTNAGLLEPVEVFEEEARRSGAWLHIDGAHGAFRALATDAPENYWAGADSVAWDPHKTLFTSYPAGILLLRDPSAVGALAHRPHYAFQDGGGHHPAFAHIEGSRGFDALKVWMTIQHFGRDGLRALADHLLALASYLAQRVAADPSFELVVAPDTNIVCFRWSAAPADMLDGLNCAVQEALYREARFLLSRTRIGGRIVLRAVLQNPMTNESHLDAMLDAVRARACELQLGRHGDGERELPRRAYL